MTLSDIASEIACLFVFQTWKHTHTHKLNKTVAWTVLKTQPLGKALLENLMIDGVGAQSLQMRVASPGERKVNPGAGKKD